MGLYSVIGCLLIVDGVFHFFQTLFYGFDKRNVGPIIFGIIYVALGVLLLNSIAWVKWPALVLPSIGFIGLTATWQKSYEAKWIKCSIWVLDVIVISGLIYLYFIQ